MSTTRWFVVLALLAAASSLAGLGALAAGAAFLSGTNTAAEREIALVASVLGFVAGGVLLAMSALRSDAVGRPAAAVGAFLAALAFATPAVQAFAATVNTPTDDSTGCGSISTPTKAFRSDGGELLVTETCRDRLNVQKLFVLVLALPTLTSTGVGLGVGLRPARPDRSGRGGPEGRHLD